MPTAASETATSLDLPLLAVLVVIGALLVVGARTRIPYPILLVLGGGALGYVPGIPDIQLEPELVLVLFLPPILYEAAFFSSIRDLRDNARPIGLLALGGSLITTVGVAVVAHEALDIAWEPAFVLGAVVAPTDPVAATAIASRLGAPNRFVTTIEGESLINDAVALSLYKFAVAAVVTGTFSLASASVELLYSAAGGVAIGLTTGYVVAWIRRRLHDPPTEIIISFVAPFVAYLPAEAAGLSAVLAVVTVGLFLGFRSHELAGPETRIQAYAVWDILTFTLNATLFVLIGLQLPTVIDEVSGASNLRLLADALVISGAVVLIRLVYMFAVSPVLHPVDDDHATPGHTFILAWTGFRGAVSLAAALAIPLETDAGQPFPERDLIVFLAYAVIFTTLVLQGLSLSPLIKRLGLRVDDELAGREAEARVVAAQAALDRLDEVGGQDWVRHGQAERMREFYEYRRDRFRSRLEAGDDDDLEGRSQAYQRLRREILDAERQAIVALRDEGRINDDVMRRLERDLDLEAERLDS